MKFSELPVGAIFEFVLEPNSPAPNRKYIKKSEEAFNYKAFPENPSLLRPRPDAEVRLMCTGNTETCLDAECLDCGERDCPDHEPLHYHHDGCPARCHGRTSGLSACFIPPEVD